MPTPTALHDPQIARTDRGAVTRCPCCGDLDLRFDGVDVTLTAPQLRRMHRTVATVRTDAADAPWGWALRAETDRQTAVFRLVGDDTDALADLLDAAVAVLDLDALLLDALGPRPAA